MEVEHLLVRFSDKWAPSDGTIATHQRVLANLGHVWIAKFGRTVGLSRIRALQKQIDSGVPTFLVLLTSTRKFSTPSSPFGAAFRIDRAQAEGPSRDDPGVPKYYARFPLPARTWFRATTCIQLQRSQLDGIRVRGSPSRVMETLTYSMAGAFRLRITAPVLADFNRSKGTTTHE